MILSDPFSQDEFIEFIKGFLPDFKLDIRKVEVGSSGFSEVLRLGESTSLLTSVLIVRSKKNINSRISLTNNSFKILKNHQIYRALIVYVNEDETIWRFSLLTALPTFDSSGNIIIKYSNPRRHSYVLGTDAGVATARKYLSKMGPIQNFDDLQLRFSVEVVNKDFYADISNAFYKLVGNSNRLLTANIEQGILDIPESEEIDLAKQQFAVRLIGRLVFCWFLRQKKSTKEIPLIPNIFFDVKTEKSSFYQERLEPLFFETLNKPFAERLPEFINEPYSLVPYLNGGLFYPKHGHGGDYYDSATKSSEKLGIPNKWFIDFFEILERFNFTVDENSSLDMDLSVDPEMLGRIFENLLAEINPDTGEAARKSTGSFYTPRSVVDYMVDRTIFYYLERKTSIFPEKLNALISYDQIDDHEFPLEDQEKKAVALALHKFKIFDPACGSGAFPIGMLQKLVWIQQQVDPNAEIWLDVQLSGISNELQKHLKSQVNNQKFDYLRKLSVIRESLFGVDIQPIATEMSRLRCFLTLIVEEDVKDHADNRGIQPLPNLEFKFITANSLLDLSEVNEDTSNHPSMFDDNKLLNELKDMRDKYFTSTGKSRSKIMDSFFKVQKEMQSNLNTLQFGETTKAFRKLAEWDPFGVDGVDWFDPQWMFGVSEFDAIICNPPYVGEKGHKEIFREISQSGLGKFYQGKMDLFYFFFHLALNNAKSGAIITFITTNYFPTASGARSLRSDLRDRSSIIEIINFNELRIFESALGQHNMITIFSKSKEQAPVKILSVYEKGTVKSKNLEELLSNASSSTIFTYLPESKIYDGIDNYIRFPSVGFEEVLDKMVRVSRHLIDICNVNTGIQTGADKFSKSLASKYPSVKAEIGEGIFQISLNESDKFKNKSRLKPFFKNSDVKRWYANEISISNLIYLRPEDSISKEEIKHLEKFRIILEDRWESNAQGSNPWWMLWRARKLDIFESEKIICSQRSANNRFAFTSKPWFASADVYFITSKNDRVNLKSILGLLNSRLYYVWLYHKGKRKGDVLELYQNPLSEIPIPIMDHAQEKAIEKLVDIAITSSRDGKLEELIRVEKMIDSLVYDLFDLRPDECAAVEEFWNAKEFTASTIIVDN